MGPAIRFSLLMLILCGLLYPLALTGIGQAVFPNEANGSLVRSASGEVQGSILLAQAFTRADYFHPRPSTNNYDGANSGGSNLGATSQKLVERILKDSQRYGHSEGTTTVPVDAVTASASGLDPDITLANALAQAPRVAQARGMQPSAVEALIRQNQEPAMRGILSEPSVNVLKLNLALDQTNPRRTP